MTIRYFVTGIARPFYRQPAYIQCSSKGDCSVPQTARRLLEEHIMIAISKLRRCYNLRNLAAAQAKQLKPGHQRLRLYLVSPLPTPEHICAAANKA